MGASGKDIDYLLYNIGQMTFLSMEKIQWIFDPKKEKQFNEKANIKYTWERDQSLIKMFQNWTIFSKHFFFVWDKQR